LKGKAIYIGGRSNYGIAICVILAEENEQESWEESSMETLSKSGAGCRDSHG